jgi:hypothetical protein
MFDALKSTGFQVEMLHHAEAILMHDMPDAALEIEEVLSKLRIPIEEIVKSGGGEGAATQRIRRSLSDEHHWIKHNFEIKKIVDGVERESVSHEIDHVKRFGQWTCALELEWNNKDPFFDRDLENFKRLHADGVISVGAIITRGTSLQASLRDMIERFADERFIREMSHLDIYYEPTSRQKKEILKAHVRFDSFAKGWSHAFVSDKFGQASTHWAKLQDRVRRGVGNPCPLLLIGIPAQTVVF